MAGFTLKFNQFLSEQDLAVLEEMFHGEMKKTGKEPTKMVFMAVSGETFPNDGLHLLEWTESPSMKEVANHINRWIMQINAGPVVNSLN